MNINIAVTVNSGSDVMKEERAAADWKLMSYRLAGYKAAAARYKNDYKRHLMIERHRRQAEAREVV